MSSDSSSVPHCKTYFHMHYVSMQPNKKRLRPLQLPWLGQFLSAPRKQHLQTAFSLHKYLWNLRFSLLPIALSK